MNFRDNPWNGKESRSTKAKDHHIKMVQMYPDYIEKCINESRIFNGYRKGTHFMANNDTEIVVSDADSVSAIFNEETVYPRMTVLNFASYKNPGGAFMKGSIAQEEALCHESILYEILSSQKLHNEFYVEHYGSKLNSGLYGNETIYSPNVIFEHYGKRRTCNVITTAAPNAGTARRYYQTSTNEILTAMTERIHTVLEVAAFMQTDCLILGAFGCGVFDNSPYDVASIFKNFLNTTYKDVFKKVVFAIPASTRNDNYAVFQNVFKEV